MMLDKQVLVAVIGLLTVVISAIFKNKYGYNRAFIKTLENERHINMILSEMKIYFIKQGIQRINIFHYHNGGKFYSGHPRQKVSMTHEQCVDDSPRFSEFQEMPISYFAELAWYLQKNGEVVDMNLRKSHDEDKPYEYGSYRKMLIESGSVTHIGYAIYRDIFMFRWHPIFLFKDKKMVASIHITFSRVCPLTETEKAYVNSKVDRIRKLIV